MNFDTILPGWKNTHNEIVGNIRLLKYRKRGNWHPEAHDMVKEAFKGIKIISNHLFYNEDQGTHIKLLIKE